MKSKSATTELEADVDALFKLPLAEFTGARNTLAAGLKKSGRGDDAARLKALVKPSISAWAVNQLYWNHREAFDELITSGERFHKAQTSGKVAVMREALDARRKSLTHLTDLATSLLRDASHNPAPDTIRRITTTLEGISAYASRSDAPRPGRLTADVDPPGFELFGTTEVTRVMPSQKSIPAVAHTRRVPVNKVRQLEETRKAKMATARVSLQEAKGSLSAARARAKSLEVAEKKALTDAKEAEKKRREAEERLEKAKAASEEAAGRARSIAVEIREAASAEEDAERSVEQASKELEKLFGEELGR